jgi:pimeloyl-ACP methyl ester carboxylesterase
VTRLTLERPDATLIGTAVGVGPTTLLLHAGGERRQVWDPVAGRLATAGFRVVFYDLRGHGESEGANAERLEAHADDVGAMIAAVGGPAVVAGASLGGLAALLALGEPTIRDRVAGLVLVDVTPDLPAVRVRAYLNGLREGLADRPLVVDVLDHRQSLRAAAVELVGLPILLIRGGRSHLTAADAQRLVELAPNAEVVVVAAAGHLVAADAPDALASLLIRYLKPITSRQ